MLKKLEIGDQIAATIYEKDDTLYDIRVVQIPERRPDSAQSATAPRSPK